MIPDQKIILDNVIYDVVATVQDEETKKNYVVFINNKEKTFKLLCTLYYEENGKIMPVKITEVEDKQTALEIIDEVMERLKGK